MRYNDVDTHKYITSIHATVGGQFTKPGESPDGTKTAFRSNFLQPTDSNSDVFVVVTEYSNPPEIESVNGSGASTVHFSRNLEKRGQKNVGPQ